MADDTAVAATNFRNARASSAAVALDDVVVAFRLAPAASIPRLNVQRFMSPTANSSLSSGRPDAASQPC